MWRRWGSWESGWVLTRLTWLCAKAKEWTFGLKCYPVLSSVMDRLARKDMKAESYRSIRDTQIAKSLSQTSHCRLAILQIWILYQVGSCRFLTSRGDAKDQYRASKRQTGNERYFKNWKCYSPPSMSGNELMQEEHTHFYLGGVSGASYIWEGLQVGPLQLLSRRINQLPVATSVASSSAIRRFVNVRH
jgi:hypothetical protein